MLTFAVLYRVVTRQIANARDRKSFREKDFVLIQRKADDR